MAQQMTSRLSLLLRPCLSLKRKASIYHPSLYLSSGDSAMISTTPTRLFSTSRATETASNKPAAAVSNTGVRRGVGGGPLHPDSVDPFKPQPRRRMDLKLGPYAGGRLFVSPREDPKEFILCVIVVAIFLYTLIHTYTQPGGETVNQRRRRIIKERLMKEAGITQADLDQLEADEAPLSN